MLDLGSGAQTLKRYLKGGCQYQPADIVRSTSDVLLSDFNRGEYPEVTKVYDYVVASGLLEYLGEPRQFLSIAPSLGNVMIVSYAPLREGESRLHRRLLGWVNSLRRGELEGIFTDLGLDWQLVAHWGDQLIYKVKAKPRSATGPVGAGRIDNNLFYHEGIPL